MLVVGRCWLLDVVSCWSMVNGCWLLDVGCWRFVGSWRFVVVGRGLGRWLLVIVGRDVVASRVAGFRIWYGMGCYVAKKKKRRQQPGDDILVLVSQIWYW